MIVETPQTVKDRIRAGMREAFDNVREQLKNDPVPVEHRYYSPDDVYEMLDAAEPERG